MPKKAVAVLEAPAPQRKAAVAVNQAPPGGAAASVVRSIAMPLKSATSGGVQAPPVDRAAVLKKATASLGGGGAPATGSDAGRAAVLKRAVASQGAAPPAAVAATPAHSDAQRAGLPGTAAPAAIASPATAAASGEIDWDELGAYMGDMTSKINEGLGKLGGFGGGRSGGGSVRFSAGGGGGAAGAGPGGGAGGGTPDLSSSQDELMKLDPKYQQAIDALGAEAQGMQGKLVALDPTVQADLDKARDAQLARSRQAFGDQKDDLLTRLFAGGTQQSSIAGDMGGRMVADQALVEGDIEGQSAERAIGLRQDMTREQRELIALRAQMAQGQSDAALQELGINVDQLEHGRDRDADMWKAKLNASTELQAAGIHASASAASAGASADASKFNSLVGLFGDQLRTKEGARQFDAGLSLDRDKFNADSGFRREEIDLDKLRSDRDYDLGKRDIGVRRAAINAENKRFSDQLGFDRERYAGDSAFRDKEFGEDTRRFDLGYGLDRERYELDKYRTEKEMYFRGKELKYGRRKAIAGSIAGIAGAMGGSSDERLKCEITPLDGTAALAAVRGVSWRWRSDGRPSAGVVAQELAQVLPEAVTSDSAGYLVVDYGFVIASLVEAVRDLTARVAKLES